MKKKYNITQICASKKAGLSLALLLIICIYDSVLADSISLFKKIIHENSKIKTIDANIVQHLYVPESPKEIFKGRYRANSAGNFRIDYTSPSTQVVTNSKEGLYWYYPEECILYQIRRNNSLSISPKINPFQEFLFDDFDKRFIVQYLGKHLYGFFIFAHQFVIKDKKNGTSIDIWIDVKKNVILERIARDKNEMEIVKEIYSGHKKNKNILIPTRVDVFTRTDKGIVRNTTMYSNIRLNYNIPMSIFKIKHKRNIVKRYMDE